MSSLVSCRGEENIDLAAKTPSVQLFFPVPPTRIWAPLGALCCPNTFPVSIFPQWRKEWRLEPGITRRSILVGVQWGRDHPPPQIAAPLALPRPAAGIRLEGLTERCGNRDPCSEDSQRHTASAWLEPVRSHRSPGGVKGPSASLPAPQGTRAGTAAASQREPGELRAAQTHPPPRRRRAP